MFWGDRVHFKVPAVDICVHIALRAHACNELMHVGIEINLQDC
jgi:hypothetical protein